jgi:hypothetical protein
MGIMLIPFLDGTNETPHRQIFSTDYRNNLVGGTVHNHRRFIVYSGSASPVVYLCKEVI